MPIAQIAKARRKKARTKHQARNPISAFDLAILVDVRPEFFSFVVTWNSGVAIPD